MVEFMATFWSPQIMSADTRWGEELRMVTDMDVWTPGWRDLGASSR